MLQTTPSNLPRRVSAFLLITACLSVACGKTSDAPTRTTSQISTTAVRTARANLDAVLQSCLQAAQSAKTSREGEQKGQETFARAYQTGTYQFQIQCHDLADGTRLIQVQGQVVVDGKWIQGQHQIVASGRRVN